MPYKNVMEQNYLV